MDDQQTPRQKEQVLAYPMPQGAISLDTPAAQKLFVLPFAREAKTSLPAYRARLHDSAHTLLHACLYARLGRAGDSILRTPAGKPYLPDAPETFFSLSHCDGLIACCLDSRPVGVDVEALRPVSPVVQERALTRAEMRQVAESGDPVRTFLTLWTLKEAYAKCTGEGLHFPLDWVSFDVQRTPVVRKGRREIGCWTTGFAGRKGRFVLSVCHLDEQPAHPNDRA